MKHSTRERLIEAGLNRFYRDGFRNVGIDQILRDVSISKTAFYKHFESKEDLMLAVLDDRARWLQETFRQMVRERGGDSATSQLRALFDVVEMIIESDDYRGCLFINVAMEFPLPHEPAHIAAAQSKKAIESLIFEIAVQGAVEAPRALAQELALVIDGAYTSRQVTSDPETVAVARRIAERVIAAHLPTEAEAASA